MKDLKFRIWNKQLNRFGECPMPFDDDSDVIYHDVYISLNGNVCDVNPIESCQCPEPVSDYYILMQYTGFTDKQNVEIFEGDILEVAGGSRITVEDLSSFLIYCGRYEEKHGVPLFDCLTVVGNVYEHCN